jgi:hypothetical protein
MKYEVINVIYGLCLVMFTAGISMSIYQSIVVTNDIGWGLIILGVINSLAISTLYVENPINNKSGVKN